MAASVLASDNVRKVVEVEGLEARNLLNWNVIVSGIDQQEAFKTAKKPPVSPRPQSASPKPPLPSKDIDGRFSKRCSLHHPKSRMRSSSVGRNPEKSLRARYWAFLFENLYRAVDEIYQTCEMDESVVESKEAIMMLENYCKEFQALIQWLNISKNYEVTPPPNRPTSLAWEVRKSLPSKSLLKTAFLDKIGSGNCPKKKSESHGDLFSKTISVQTEIKGFDLTTIDNLKSSTDEVLLIETGIDNSIKDSDVSSSVTTNSFVSNQNILCIADDHVDNPPSVQCSSDSITKTTNVETETLKNIPSLNLTDNEAIDNEIRVPNEVHFEENEECDTNTTDIKEKDLTVKISDQASSCETVENIETLTDKTVEQLLIKTCDESTSTITFSEIGIQTLPTEKYPLGAINKTNSTAVPKTKLPSDIAKNSSTVKKAVVTTSNTKTLNKSPLNTVTANASTSIKEVSKRLTTMPSRLLKTTATKSINPIKPVNQRNVPETKPFRTGNYEPPKIRCASHVTMPSNFRKYGSLKSSNDSTPSHTSRPSQHHIGKDSIKSGSTSSLSSTSSAKSWVDKARERSLAGSTKFDSTDDGWEMVKGRTRCKNSPAKKLTGTQNTLDKVIAAKLNQNKMGGFVYNCTSTSGKLSSASSKEKISKDFKSTEELNEDKKLKTNTNLKSKKASENLDLTKNRKKINTPSRLISNIKNNDSDKKNVLLRQLSIDNLKKIVNVPGTLKKSYSSCSLEVKKSKSSIQNSSSPKTMPKNNTESKLVPSAVKVINQVEESSLKNNASAVPLNVTKNKMENEVKDDGSNKNVEDVINTQDSDCDDTSVSNDLDGMACQDENLSDAQKLILYEKMFQDEAQEDISALALSWGDQMDILDMELRTPGRALQMHEKLSSPFRKRPLSETIRLQEEKQLKAQEQRERLLEEKAQRSKDIQRKVEEMKALNEKKAERQRIILEQKLQRAEEKRKKQIEMIIRKAHDEEEKVNEIAFINTLEAQNKRHDLISKEKDHEARLHDIQEERQRKLEEKAAKEAAAEERRKHLEAERQARLLEMQEKRKLRDLKVEQQLLEKEKERQEIANQKARERELRISAMNAAQQIFVEELHKKIQLKQEESARRHDENMAQIRQKAFELTVRRYSSNNDDAPQLVPYETKKICTICNVLIGSEVYLLSHLRGKKHQAMIADQHQGHDPSTEELELYNLKHIVDASTDQLDPNIALDKERQKALKKRCKKLRQRLEKRASEFEKSLPKISSTTPKIKLQKIMNELKKISLEQWDDGSLECLDKSLSVLKPGLKTLTVQDKIEFRLLGGLNLLLEILSKICLPVWKNHFSINKKTSNHLFEITEFFLKGCYENCVYILFINKVGQALDVLNQRLNVLIPDNFSQILMGSTPSHSHSPPTDEIAGELMLFLGFILNYLSKRDASSSVLQKILDNDPNANQKFETQITDVVSYAVSIGIVDRISQYFNYVRGPIDSKPEIALFVRQCLTFLTSLMKFNCDSYSHTLERKKMDDVTQFLATLKVTDLVGAVSLLYCILLHDGSPPIQKTPPPELPHHTTLLTLAALRMLNQIAVMNLHLIQSVLGGEGLSLQLRHIASYLLWYCSHWSEDILLHELILLLGYFTVSNSDNQVLIQAGQSPTVLQQLCALPFIYFSNSTETEILFPTLIACSYNNECNRCILKQEMAIELLSTYLEAKLLDGYSTMRIKNDPDLRWCLHTRFPKYQWSAAKLYFLK